MACTFATTKFYFAHVVGTRCGRRTRPFFDALSTPKKSLSPGWRFSCTPSDLNINDVHHNNFSSRLQFASSFAVWRSDSNIRTYYLHQIAFGFARVRAIFLLFSFIYLFMAIASRRFHFSPIMSNKTERLAQMKSSAAAAPSFTFAHLHSGAAEPNGRGMIWNAERGKQAMECT